MLAAFVNSNNRVLNRDHLLDMVSGRDWAPNDRTIDVMVRQLRKKMEDDPSDPKIFAPVHGVGYNFAPDVE
ncbi:MAG: helix-turn-helix domain-containing protein [Rhodospirillales bacterium]|nr:helix-turn-helix domain-containing protein [Rhodospirillales bacterium]